MPQLSLFLFGPPQLELDSKPLNIGRRKAVALFVYLAVSGQGHTRDALATLFWPDYDQPRARAALRRTLSTLNRALGGSWLEADRETIDLQRGDDLWVDVAAFHRRLAAVQAHGHSETETCPECMAHLTEAVALYGDDFMAGFTLRDSMEFDDWQFFQAESLRRDLALVLERLVCGHCARGEIEPAVDYARRWLRLDPLQEVVHRWLMRLYAGTGQRPAALRQYQECVRILEAELGVAPSAETTKLFRRIQSGEHLTISPQAESVGEDKLFFDSLLEPISPHQPEDLAPGIGLPAFLDGPEPPPTPLPFVAREEELLRLTASLETALGGGGHVAFVTGEAGSGKTALVQEFARRVQEEVPELVVAFGSCNAHTGVGDPYLPFREILGLLIGDAEARRARGALTYENARRLSTLHPTALQTLVEVSPELINSFVSEATLAAQTAAPAQADRVERLERIMARRGTDEAVIGMAQRDLLESYTQLLSALARARPMLLVVDDAQWADVASINLLFHLSRRLADNRILLVVTYRPNDVALGRDGKRHPLEPVINELRRTYGDIWIDLDPAMGRHFVDALLDTQPNRLPDDFRVALAHQTEGHPLFTIELLRDMRERGDLVRDAEGHWIEGPALNWERLPARVEAVIQERVGRLEAGLRDILAVASVEGETFTAQVVARVQGIGERPLLGALSQELERRHQLVQSRGEVQVDHQFLSRFRFTHTLFQQYLYNTFSPGERRLLHGEIAVALEDLYQEEGDKIIVQLARHYAEAGRVEQAISYLLRAGDRAREVYAYQEAIEFYERALAFLKQEAAYEQAARTLMKLGLTYHLNFDFPRARGAYQEGFALWQRAGASPATPSAPAPHPLRLLWHSPPSLDPTRTTDDTSGLYIQQLFSGLVRLNRELDVVPELAASWEMLEGGERWVFHLRDRARWSDGQPVTAEDFVYAWRRMLDPASSSAPANYLFDIKGAQAYHQGVLSDPDQLGVRALDPTTLLVELEGPTGYFPLLLTQPMLYPVPRHVVETHGDSWTKPEHLVTNGPFRLERWEPDRSMLLTRDPNYLGEITGNVEQIELTLEEATPSELFALYEADRLDLVILWPSLESDQVRQRHAGEYMSGPAMYTQYIGFNVKHPPFDDARVRRALAMAIDKEKIANVTLAGYYFPATGGLVPPEMPGHSPGIGLAHDPAQARRLLAEAGYPEGQGFPKVNGLVTRHNKKHGADELRAQWRQTLGIDVGWQGLEWGELLQRLEHKLPALLSLGWRADYPDPDNPLRLSTHIQWTGWYDPTYVRLLEEARHVADHQVRMKLYQRADRLLVEEAAIVPIVYGRHQFLIKPWVRRISPSAMAWQLWKDVIIEPH